MKKKQLTHGEAYVIKRENARLIDGEVIFENIVSNAKMDYNDAVKYYNSKFSSYFLKYKKSEE